METACEERFEGIPPGLLARIVQGQVPELAKMVRGPSDCGPTGCKEHLDARGCVTPQPAFRVLHICEHGLDSYQDFIRMSHPTASLNQLSGGFVLKQADGGQC